MHQCKLAIQARVKTQRNGNHDQLFCGEFLLFQFHFGNQNFDIQRQRLRRQMSKVSLRMPYLAQQLLQMECHHQTSNRAPEGAWDAAAKLMPALPPVSIPLTSIPGTTSHLALRPGSNECQPSGCLSTVVNIKTHLQDVSPAQHR